MSERVSQWAETLNGFVWRSGKENCMVGFTNVGLQKALEDKFSILDRVREIKLENKLAPTLSIGISGEGATLAEISMNASKALDLALGRGGDQVVVQAGKEMQYFGGTSTVNAKSTRVRVRIVAHTIREQMTAADRVFVMGHENEDYDAIASAVGVAKMALSLRKPVFIVYSGNSMSFEKVREYLFDEKDKMKSDDVHYLDHIVTEEEALKEITPKSLLMLVDHHRAVLCASRRVLDAIPRNRIIIDHHRRAEDVIPNTILQYMEPSSSSTSELVTELVGYFDENWNSTRRKRPCCIAASSSTRKTSMFRRGNGPSRRRPSCAAAGRTRSSYGSCSRTIWRRTRNGAASSPTRKCRFPTWPFPSTTVRKRGPARPVLSRPRRRTA